MDCAEACKKTVQAPLRQAQRAGEKGWGFLQTGDYLPCGASVIYLQVKPDCFPRSYISVYFLSAFANVIWFYIGISKIPLGCGVAVADGIKAFAVAGSGDFAPQLN